LLSYLASETYVLLFFVKRQGAFSALPIYLCYSCCNILAPDSSNFFRESAFFRVVTEGKNIFLTQIENARKKKNFSGWSQTKYEKLTRKKLLLNNVTSSKETISMRYGN